MLKSGAELDKNYVALHAKYDLSLLNILNSFMSLLKSPEILGDFCAAIFNVCNSMQHTTSHHKVIPSTENINVSVHEDLHF